MSIETIQTEVDGIRDDVKEMGVNVDALLNVATVKVDEIDERLEEVRQIIEDLPEEPGKPGPPGNKGDQGDDAYVVWLKAGNRGTIDDYLASLKGKQGDRGPRGPAGGGGGGGGRLSGVLQSVISRANFTMSSNRFKSSPLRDAPTMTPIPAVETDMTRSYFAITGGAKPWNILGGAPVVDSVGVRGTNATYDAATGARIGIVYWVDQLLDGNACNVVLDKGPDYRLLVEEDGTMKYVPQANLTLSTGSGTQIYRIQFPNHTGPRVRRRFMIESGYNKEVPIPGFQVNTAGRFISVHVAKQDQIMRPSKPSIRSVHIGDSNIMGVNGFHGAGHSGVMAAYLGLDDHYVSGIHSNGRLQSNINSPTWDKRRQDWRDPKPDLLFYNLSWVDRAVVQQGQYTPAAAAAIFLAEFQMARTAYPEMPVIVMALLWSNEGYVSQPDIPVFNKAVADAIAASGDPLIIFIEDRHPEAAITGMGRQTQEQGVGNADIYFAPDDHYGPLGDEWVGIVAAQSVLEKLNALLLSGESVPAPNVPSVFPSSLTLTAQASTPASGDLATVENASATAILSVTPAVPGVTFSLQGNVLRAAGNYPASAGTYRSDIVIDTTGGPVTFSLSAVVTALPTPPSISPSSASLTGLVGETVDALLGVVSNGVLSSVSGNTPPGTAFVRVGQELRLRGTYTAAGSDNYSAAIVTSNGPLTFALDVVVSAVTPVSITPTSRTQTSTVGQFRNGQILGEVKNGTPTGIVSGVAPAGLEFALSGPNLMMTGTYTTPAVNNISVVISTDKGNVTFTLRDTVTAPDTARINPNAATMENSYVGLNRPVTVLGVVENAVPSGTVTGTVPAGLTASVAGQNVRLSGQYTTVGVTDSTLTVATDKGPLTFNLKDTVTPAATRTPTSASLGSTVGQTRSNFVLTTIANGVPVAVTGNAPKGMTLSVRGQDIVLNGTYEVVNALSTNLTITTNKNTLLLVYQDSVSAATTPVITPSTLTLEGTTGSSAAGELGVVSGGVVSGVVSVTPAIQGVTFSTSGQSLMAAGTFPSAAGNYETNIVVGTDKGNVTFNLKANVTATGPTLTPTTKDVVGTVGTAVNELLTTVSGGDFTSFTGAAPAGTNYVREGQNLYWRGTPSAATNALKVHTVQLVTSAGNGTFTMRTSIAPDITPKTLTKSFVKDVPVDFLLGTVMGGVPNLVTADAAYAPLPAGLSYVLDGQLLILRGTPTTVATVKDCVANVRVTTETANQTVRFNLKPTITEPVTGETVLADLKFDGVEGQKTPITNDAPGDALTFRVDSPSSDTAVFLSAASARTGPTGLRNNGGAGQEGGVVSNESVTVTGKFRMEMDFRHEESGYDYGTMMAIGSWDSSSFLTMEYSQRKVDLYREKSAPNDGLLAITDYDPDQFMEWKHIVVERDADNMVTVKFDDTLILGPVLYAGAITGRIGVLVTADPGGPAFAAVQSSADNFKLTLLP